MRELLPHVAISSDFISGFCGETEDDHQQTLSLLRAVQFDKAFMFAYSMREKTHAHRRLSDDVPEEIKQRRLSEVIQAFNEGARANCQSSGVAAVRAELTAPSAPLAPPATLQRLRARPRPKLSGRHLRARGRHCEEEGRLAYEGRIH